MTDRARRIVHPPDAGTRNMAVDHALMEVGRRGGVALRFYRWSPPCLSLGRNQEARGRYDRERAARQGIDIVRRPTGGRAVFHHRELTYAVAAPAGLWGGLRECYRRVNRALLRGLSLLGADADEADRRPAGGTPGPSRRACFRDPLPGEIVAAGRKLVGSAQWRHDGALLQHGSLLLHDDQERAEELRTDGPARSPGFGSAGDGDPPVGELEAGGAAAVGERTRRRDAGGGAVRAAALADVVSELPGPRRLADALSRGFARELGLEIVDARLSAAERRRADELEPRYRDAEWTWRR